MSIVNSINNSGDFIHLYEVHFEHLIRNVLHHIDLRVSVISKRTQFLSLFHFTLKIQPLRRIPLALDEGNKFEDIKFSSITKSLEKCACALLATIQFEETKTML